MCQQMFDRFMKIYIHLYICVLINIYIIYWPNGIFIFIFLVFMNYELYIFLSLLNVIISFLFSLNITLNFKRQRVKCGTFRTCFGIFFKYLQLFFTQMRKERFSYKSVF